MNDSGHSEQSRHEAAESASALSFRPGSFYLLWAIPVVLVLSLHTFVNKEDPHLFVFGLATLFVFIGVILARALIDIIEILRSHVIDADRDYRETLGANDFTGELARRVQDGSLAALASPPRK